MMAEFLEIDRRGSSCPTLFAWNGERYEFVADMLGAAVVGHWIGLLQSMTGIRQQSCVLALSPSQVKFLINWRRRSLV